MKGRGLGGGERLEGGLSNQKRKTPPSSLQHSLLKRWKLQEGKGAMSLIRESL